MSITRGGGGGTKAYCPNFRDPTERRDMSSLGGGEKGAREADPFGPYLNSKHK